MEIIMKNLFLKYYRKYKEMILYVFFGGCTTLVNVISYIVCTRVFHIHLLMSTIIAWLLAVLFAYVTNRKYVFLSENTSARSILFEFISFISCRLLTGAVDVGIMYVFVDRLGFNDLLIKILSNLFVIVTNYIASRLIIFKAHDKKENLSKR
jgi:putative flippase GtrA